MGALRLRLAAAVVALGFVLALVAGSTGPFGGTRALAGSTSLTVIAGDVSVSRGGADFAAAADGETLSAGDTVRTGADGRAVLTYFEGSTVTIEPGTELRVEAASAMADGSTVVLMRQAFGRTWHVVTKLITGGSKYEVRTPASTASVRGTEFEVDSSSDETTITTTEGTVVQHVPDPARPDTTVDVPVGAGRTQTQPRNAPAEPSKPASEPKRKVTVTVDAENSIVVDPFGRANGITKSGKLVVQTPGAQVRRVDGKIVITLPELPDGTLTTRIAKDGDGDDARVPVTARVEDQDRAMDLVDDATPEGDSKVAGFEVRRGSDGNLGTRALEDGEKLDLPTAKIADARDDPAESVASSTRSTRSTDAKGRPARGSSRDARRSSEFRTLAPRAEQERGEAPASRGAEDSSADAAASNGAGLVVQLNLSLPSGGPPAPVGGAPPSAQPATAQSVDPSELATARPLPGPSGSPDPARSPDTRGR